MYQYLKNELRYDHLNLRPTSHEPVKKLARCPPLLKLNSRYLEYAAVVAVGQKASLATTHDAAHKFVRQATPLQEQLLEIAEKSPNWVGSRKFSN